MWKKRFHIFGPVPFRSDVNQAQVVTLSFVSPLNSNTTAWRLRQTGNTSFFVLFYIYFLFIFKLFSPPLLPKCLLLLIMLRVEVTW